MTFVRRFYLLAAMLLAASVARAEDPEPTPAAPESADVVAAVVNGETISASEVNNAAASVLQGRKVAPEVLAQLQAQVLSQLIDRRLIMQMLVRTGKAATSAEVTEAMDKLRQQAEEQKIEFAKLLAERRLTEAELRDSVAWQLSWGKYAQSQLEDNVLKAYFEAHRRDFDGTQLRVSHILLRPDNPGDPSDTERLRKIALKLREQIQAGQVTFAAAAEKYSAGPSRNRGGDLGFIPRHGLMLEPFSTAAFQLETGEISEPVITAFGVHLIRVTAIKAGDKTWSSLKDELKAPAAQQLFDALAAKERQKALIKFPSNFPHFKPGTKELAKPSA
jgi:parvulin-like peptidyl-prolyl isomerase